MTIRTIQDAIDEGIVAVYGDIRSGTFFDRSNNMNDGTPSDITLDFIGASFPTDASNISIADDASLKGSNEGCLVVLSDETATGRQRMFSKHDGGGTQFDWFFSAGLFAFHDGVNTRTIAQAVEDVRMHSVNFKTGETPEHFVDGGSTGFYNGMVTITDDTADLIIGNFYTLAGDNEFKSTLQAYVYFTRKLAQEEMITFFETFSLDQDFGEARPFQEGDVDLFQTPDEGDIDVTDGFTRMTGRFGTAVYLSLFGGNEDDPGGQNEKLSWWGNVGVTDPAMRYRSETQHILQALPATSANLLKLQEAAVRDLKWLEDVSAVSQITAEATIPALNRIDLKVVIEAFGERETFNFVNNWGAPQ